MSTSLSTGPVAPSASWVCPRCGGHLTAEPDETGMVACTCGHRAYAGYIAEADYLHRRLEWLGTRISAGDPAPDAETARRFGVWPASAAAPQAAPLPPPTARHLPGVQTLLLGLGAGLLIVAGIVFTAVVWDRLGAVGQVGIMAAATLGFGVLAVRLVRRLPGTAEALGVVAFGLTAVDVVAAPALGLVPDTWLDVDRAYPAAVAVGCAALAVVLGHVFAVRAWVWLGWLTAAAAATLTTWYLALGPADSDQPWAALSVAVVALAAVGLLSWPHLQQRRAVDLRPMTVAGAVALLMTVPAWVAWVSDLDRPALLGTLITTVLTAAASAVVWLRGRLPLAGVGAALLTGIAGTLALVLLPTWDQSAWLGAVAAAAGVVLLVLLARFGHLRVGLLASAALWATWAVFQLAISQPDTTSNRVFAQLAVLLGLGALTWFVVSALGREPVMAWPAAVVGEVALLAAAPSLPDLPNLPETWALPFAALLLAAGYLWHRSSPVGSLTWLGPGVTMALLPSAFACWGAPWVADATEQTSGEGLIRLVALLVVGVAVVGVGARRRSSGLLLPGTAALAVTAAAQTWGGLSALPRWLALGLAGATLIVLGARLEWLRQRGHQARTFVGTLR